MWKFIFCTFAVILLTKGETEKQESGSQSESWETGEIAEIADYADYADYEQVNLEVTLCCPVGLSLDASRMCTLKSSADVKDRVSRLTQTLNPKWRLLPPDARPYTRKKCLQWNSESKLCLNVGKDSCDNSRLISELCNGCQFDLFEYGEVPHPEIDLCCPSGKFLNTDNDECEASNKNKESIIGVQTPKEDSNFLSPYELREIPRVGKKIQCNSVKYLINPVRSAFKFYVTNQQSLIGEIPNNRKYIPSGVRTLFLKGMYCVAMNQKGGIVARVCHSDLCSSDSSRCIKKCCPPGEGYNTSCFKSDRQKRHQVDSTPGIKSMSKEDFELRIGKPECPFGKTIIVNQNISSDEKLQFDLMFWTFFSSSFHTLKPENGSLQIETVDVPDVLCYDEGLDKESGSSIPVVVKCVTLERDKTLLYLHRQKAISMVISCMLLIPIVAVYIILPELRNMHGYAIIFQCSSLFIHLICMTIFNLNVDIERYRICTSLALFNYYFLIASFSWLTVLGMDMYNSLKNPMAEYSSIQRRGVKKKTLFLYSTFAWSIPALFVVSVVSYSRQKSQKACLFDWFFKDFPLLFFLYIPALSFALVNTVTFVHLAIILRKSAASAATITGDEQIRRKRLQAVVRLFLIIGIFWVFDILSYFIGGYSYLWISLKISEEVLDDPSFNRLAMSNAVNVLKYVCYFAIFVCRKKVLDLVTTRYPAIGDRLQRQIPITQIFLRTRFVVIGAFLCRVFNMNGKHVKLQIAKKYPGNTASVETLAKDVGCDSEL